MSPPGPPLTRSAGVIILPSGLPVGTLLTDSQNSLTLPSGAKGGRSKGDRVGWGSDLGSSAPPSRDHLGLPRGIEQKIPEREYYTVAIIKGPVPRVQGQSRDGFVVQSGTFDMCGGKMSGDRSRLKGSAVRLPCDRPADGLDGWCAVHRKASFMAYVSKNWESIKDQLGL